MNEQASAWLTTVNGLPDVHDRLRQVVVLNDDALAVIGRRTRRTRCSTAIPPTYTKPRVSTDDYAHEMTAEQHERLLSTLASIEGKFLLSGYHSRLYDDAAARHGWRCTEMEIDCKVGSGLSKSKRIECVWRNCD